ncbi:hypothetical protein BC937DRAFT_91952 [Endogone sp. FLAS-F59071]|nr:hypothetical protein BC937DRAFT_91952 [Endogone sp. FLAS-F59071]|eukprot:RUS23140.1 hypothetical protein BC937DRAFT_91952 [Endogone sp. FLAS-F59071]
MSLAEATAFTFICPIPTLLFSLTTTDLVPTWARTALQILLLCLDLYIPFYVRGRYDPYLLSVAGTACIAIGMKMLVWISGGEREKGNFFWTLWFWREEMPRREVMTKEDINGADSDPQQKNKTMTEANVSFILCIRFWILLFKLILLDLLDTILKRTAVATPSQPYLLRLLHAPYETLTAHTLLHSLLFASVLYVQMLCYYEVFTVLFAFTLLLLLRNPGRLSPQYEVAAHHYLIVHLVTAPSLFSAPYLSSSSRDLWSHRWHQMFTPLFRRLARDPTARTLDVLGAPAWLRASASRLAVFTLSGLMHEYILLVICGTAWWDQGVGGWQTVFFLIQAVAVATAREGGKQERSLVMWIKVAVMMAWIVVMVPIFIEPYVRSGYHLAKRLPLIPSLVEAVW